MFYLWLHLLSFSIYFGATAAVPLICLPMASAESEPRRRLGVLAGFMRVYDPLTIAVLGIVLMTGAYSLTGFKDALRADFFRQMGGMLMWKLGWFFVLVNVAAYMAFGLGNRLVRRHHEGEEVDPAWVDSMIRRLRVSSVLALLLCALIVWIALGMTKGVNA